MILYRCIFKEVESLGHCDSVFHELKTVLDSTMKVRANQGLGLNRKTAEKITPRMEEQMWQESIVGEHGRSLKPCNFRIGMDEVGR